MSTYSKEHLEFLKKRKRNKIIIIISQLAIISLFLIIGCLLYP